MSGVFFQAIVTHPQSNNNILKFCKAFSLRFWIRKMYTVKINICRSQCQNRRGLSGLCLENDGSWLGSTEFYSRNLTREEKQASSWEAESWSFIWGEDSSKHDLSACRSCCSSWSLDSLLPFSILSWDVLTVLVEIADLWPVNDFCFMIK